jgi:Tetratricopeptide repeat
MARFIPLVFTTLLGVQAVFADPQAAKPLPTELPLSGQAPAKLVPNLCLLRYRVSTNSPECQAHFDQGLAYFYSWVYEEAAGSFETAALYDPDCAMAWWGLSRALERSSNKKPELALQALEKAREKQGQASHSEQLLITAQLQLKEPVPPESTPNAQEKAPETQRLAAIRTIDELLSLYDDDEEGWYFRAQLAGGGVSSIPFYKSLLRINPLHPGGTHDLIHYYDDVNRPALAWPYSENYIKGSPGMPHAYHMQVAHLAMHLGRWDKVIEHAARGERDMLMPALIHMGRFVEARKLENRKSVNRFYLHLAERNWNDASEVLDALRAGDKLEHDYLTALFYFNQDRPDLAAPVVEALRQALETVPEEDTKQNRRQLENRLWETQGLLQCQQGDAQAGLRLLAKVVDRTMGTIAELKKANGAYYIDTWGLAALKSGQDKVAEFAFLEALTHESGSARAALGMQILCERQGRDEEARRYRDRARRIWQWSDPGVLDAELSYLREFYPAKQNPEQLNASPAKAVEK